MTREDLIRLAREAYGGLYRPDNARDPMKYTPAEWVLEAMRAAYEAGRRGSRSEPT